MVGKKADFLIVGAGFAGATFARCASDAGYTSLVIDKRNHVGGNSYSYRDEENGVEVHQYGSHIFHTSSRDVWDFVCRFTEFNNYIHKVKVLSGGQVYGMPLNLHTINQFYKRSFGPDEARQFIGSLRVERAEIKNFEDSILDSVGRDLYEAFYLNYTIKHWGRHPSLIPVSTAKRLPVRYCYDDNYFTDTYQGIPEDGYGKLFERMLMNDKITLVIGTDFNDWRDTWRNNFRFLVYTGSIDEYFGFVHGKLPYRTVWFKEQRGKDLLGTAVMNHCDMSLQSTRIHEYKWYTPGRKFTSSVAFEEYAGEAKMGDDAYYPVHERGIEPLLQAYQRIGQEESDVLFLGRLAEFRYYDMHQVIAAAIARFRSIAPSLRDHPHLRKQ